ncbi:MAG: hypothetical protein EZS28_003880 [Streblomastix strix]|uniref:Uncharacterized protein n=1 Tax=Streblomastix strix TaxID=222440 RepID=A0A5J4X1R6_9EUKA|nr:MAG: hypothetical protein EZS28_003880 [Streblomastix strix]
MSSQLVYWTAGTPIWAQPEKIISLMSQEKEKDNPRLEHQSQHQPHPFKIEIMEDVRRLPDAERRGILADWKFSDTSLEVGIPEYPEKLALLRAYVINKHNRAIDLRDQLPQPNEVFMQSLPGGLIPLNVLQVQWQDPIKRQLQNNLANQILEALPEKVDKKKRKRHEGSNSNSESESGEQQHHKRSKNKKHRKRRRRSTTSDECSSSSQSSRSRSRSVHRRHSRSSKSETIKRDLTGIVGVSSASKFNPNKVQMHESWIRNAERHRWQHEDYWPTSEPGQQHPLEVSAVYRENAKALSLAESALLNEIQRKAEQQKPSKDVTDAYLMVLTAGARSRTIREADTQTGTRREQILLNYNQPNQNSAPLQQQSDYNRRFNNNYNSWKKHGSQRDHKGYDKSDKRG